MPACLRSSSRSARASEREEIRPGDRRLGAAHQQVPGERAGRPRPVPDRLDLREREGRPRRGHRAVQEDRRRALAAQARQRIAVMEAKSLVVITPRDVPLGRGRPPEGHDTQHREPQLHRLQAQRRGLFPQEVRARARRVARHRPGRPRRVVDGHRSPATPDTSRSRATTTSRSWICPASTWSRSPTRRRSRRRRSWSAATSMRSSRRSRDQILVFAQDMKTGRGRAGAAGPGRRRRPGRARGDDRTRRRPAPRLEARRATATAD